MKIGILTFHREINYGACLQAYALLTHLKKTQDSVEIIDFIPNSGIDRRSWKRKVLHFIKVLLSYRERTYQKKRKKFISFWNKRFILSDEIAHGDKDLRRIISKYDLLISGSDQLFNLSLSDNSFSFYLPFDNIKKISYASSFGRENISDLEKWAVLNYLPSFSNLSFREMSGYKIVSGLIDLKQENIVVDPVFLLKDYEWEIIASKKSEKGDYILIYAMEQSDWLETTIKVVSEAHPNHKLLLVKGTHRRINVPKNCKLIRAADPEEFISLLSNSSLVITNSFHGLAFSFIFKKTVYCCAHSSKNTRLEYLLSLVGEERNIISSKTNLPLPNDGSKAIDKMQSIISKSKNYLFKCIERTNNDR